MARHRKNASTTARPNVLRAARDVFYRWRFRHTETFACADCPVTYDVDENATGDELRRLNALATDHSRHGVYADRAGTPYAIAVYGG
jgi:hypothetical protein